MQIIRDKQKAQSTGQEGKNIQIEDRTELKKYRSHTYWDRRREAEKWMPFLSCCVSRPAASRWLSCWPDAVSVFCSVTDSRLGEWRLEGGRRRLGFCSGEHWRLGVGDCKVECLVIYYLCLGVSLEWLASEIKNGLCYTIIKNKFKIILIRIINFYIKIK